MTSPPARTAETHVQRDRGADPLRILLVDDDEAFAAASREQLQRSDAGLRVSTAPDGRSALRALEEESVDCVVSDYLMPGMDGLELAAKIAREHPELPFILFTGRGDEEIARRAIRGDVDDYVPKGHEPDTFDVLADRIRSCIGDGAEGSVDRGVWMQAGVGLALHDPDTGALLDVNRHYCEMLGVTRSHLLGGSGLHDGPAGGSSIPARARELIRVSEMEGPTTAEWVGQDSDGAPLWVEITLKPGVVGGQQRVVASVQDVSPRHEREAALRSMYETIADLETSFEEKVERLMTLGRTVLGTGFATLSRLAGDDYIFDQVQSPDGEIEPGDIVSIEETLCEDAVVSQQRLVVDDPAEARDRTRGKALELSCYVGAPVYLDDEVDGTFCFYDVEHRGDGFSDWEITLVDLMSRWISAERERRRVRDELERENERLDDFASLVSHDLRSPLSIAQGHLGLLRTEVDHGSIGEALAALDRIGEIVEDALTWARTGDAVGETRPVSIAATAEAAWSLVDHGGASLVLDTEETIQADAGRLQQLFENLFRNAVEHGGPGVCITVGDRQHGFFVEDDGVGFPEGAGTELLEAGYSTVQDGTGFGLAIVQQISDAHGWTLEAFRADGGGARLEVQGVEPVGSRETG